MENKLEESVRKYHTFGIHGQLDYDKFYLYSIITHSMAIEGSTINELENQIMFNNGILAYLAKNKILPERRFGGSGYFA